MPSWSTCAPRSASLRLPTIPTGPPCCWPATPGVGKTRLLTELRDRAVTEGWLVQAGHCLDFADSALPYLPFSEITGRVARELPDLFDEVAERHPALLRLLPGQRMLSMATDPESLPADQAALFDAVHALAEAAGSRQCLLLVVEDLHWADQSTRDLISFLFGRGFDAPVALIASYRSDDLHRRHPLRRQVAVWARMSGVERIQLQPLRRTDVRRLVQQLHPDPLPEARVRDIVGRAEGNAFFVEELVGATRTRTGRIPEDLAELLLVRLESLDDVGGHRGARRRRRRPPGLPRRAQRRRARRARRRSTARSATPSRDTCSCRAATTSTSSATPCSPRPSTTTSCPASAPACTRRTPGRSRTAAPPAPPPSWPGTPGSPRTSPPR